MGRPEKVRLGEVQLQQKLISQEQLKICRCCDHRHYCHVAYGDIPVILLGRGARRHAAH